MSEFDADVIVVGAGNAAFCAALAAQEHGARVLMLEAAPRGGMRRQQPLHRGRHAGGLSTASTTSRRSCPTSRDEKSRHAISAPTPTSSSSTTWRRVTQYRSDPDLAEILVRSSFETLSGCAPRASASCRSTAGRPSRSTASSSSGAGSTVEAWGGGPGPGRAHARGRGAQGRHRASRYETPRAGSAARRRAASRACGSRHDGRTQELRAEGRGAGLRRLRGQRRDAHALSRARLGPRQGARHPLQHRRRHPHGAGRSAPSRTATGRAATPSAGT